MAVENFQEKEIQNIHYESIYLDSKLPVFHYPVTQKEGWRRAVMEGDPIWLCSGVETFNFYPDVIPDNRSHGFFNDGGATLTDDEKGGKGLFGIPWVYIPMAGGAIEDPNMPPLFTDANDWEKSLTWPDIEAWDWEGCAARNKAFLDNGKFNYLTLFTGFGFERLISFMGFENASIAMIDEDQEDALKALLDRLSDLYCGIVDKCCQYFAIDGFRLHDDWGSQRAPFFSFETAHALLVPNMKKVVDRMHAHGKLAEIHSCGKNETMIENFIEAGWDFWSPQANVNDTQMLFEKYGDRICIGVYGDPYDEKDDEATLREKAREFAKTLCADPKKRCVVSSNFLLDYPSLAYAEELYKTSRLLYGEK